VLNQDLAARSRWMLQQLQRQMAYGRLLERLCLLDGDWIIKGATALLARDIGVRGTIDIDLYRYVAREISDKACAIFERHSPTGIVSTRYRDLVDLVAVVLAE
jgi:hypothetical protein